MIRPIISNDPCAGTGFGQKFSCAMRAGVPVAIALTAAALFGPAPARSQTLSCAVASTPAQFEICNSETLQVLDEQVDSAFEAALAANETRPGRQQINRQQERWKVERETCKADSACLEQHYQRRLDELSGGPSAQVPITSFTRFAQGG
jgi:uncharacterized protein